MIQEQVFLLYCFAAIMLVIKLQICVWIFEYLGGLTFK